MKKQVRINVGAGRVHLPGYIRADIDESTEPDVYCDAEVLDLSFDLDSADVIRASHLLEHIPPGEFCFNALVSWWKVLKPGGVLYVIVPDAGAAKLHAEWDVFEKVILGGDPGATEFMIHKNIFDHKKLKRYLEITGYINIEVFTIVGNYEIVMRAEKPKKEAIPESANRGKKKQNKKAEVERS